MCALDHRWRARAAVTLSYTTRLRHSVYVTDEERLQQMIDELGRMRERCEPKSSQNPRYLRYSNAVSALRWIIDDIAKERALG
jgi:hypothetical protein